MTNVDYYISEICYNKEHTHIVKVKMHPSDNIDSSNIYTKLAVVEALEKGIVIYTMYKENDGKWYEGAKVRVVTTTSGNKYIRTDSNSTAKDNLGDLPEFC